MTAAVRRVAHPAMATQTAPIATTAIAPLPWSARQSAATQPATGTTEAAVTMTGSRACAFVRVAVAGDVRRGTREVHSEDRKRLCGDWSPFQRGGHRDLRPN